MVKIAEGSDNGNKPVHGEHVSAKGGREKEGGISLAARELPIPGTLPPAIL